MSTPETATLIPGSEGQADGGSTDFGTTGTPEADNGSQRVSKEARYRVERNEARAERDALTQRVERMQRAEVERVAGEHLAMPGDLFSLSGNDVADYLTESGEVDAAKVAADVDAVLAERPGLRKNAPAFDPTQGHGGQPKPKTPAPSWESMFSGSGATPNLYFVGS